MLAAKAEASRKLSSPAPPTRPDEIPREDLVNLTMKVSGTKHSCVRELACGFSRAGFRLRAPV